MSRETVSRVIYRCDLCTKDCTPVRILQREAQRFSTTGKLTETIILRLPVQTSMAGESDICPDCLTKLLGEILKKGIT